MCGIVGYVGKEKAAPILIESIKRLEYRGYDSCGIATIIKKQNDVLVDIRKDAGRIEEVSKRLKFDEMEGNIGIAHTRWATHGKVDQKNAHPHFSCKKDFVLVHNGIIENWQELKSLLKGHNFRSETDTEILVHLIEKFYQEQESPNVVEAILKALKLVEGAYAIALITTYEPKKIFIAKKSSPLVIGKGKEEMFIASDITALLPYTNKFKFLEDNEIAIISEKEARIINLKKKYVNREFKTIKKKVDEITKKGFPHYMLKEIFEQPKTIQEAFKGRTKRVLFGFDDKELGREVVNKINKIILVGCGTSLHAAMIGKYLIEKIARIDCKAEHASEFRYCEPIIDKNTLVIVLSQSGETADTIAALRLAKEKGARTLGLVNVVASTIARETHSGFYLHAGTEIGVASTKTFTSHLVILFLLSLYFAYVKGKIKKEKIKEMLRELEKVPKKIKKILEMEKEIKKIALKYFKAKNALYLGRGIEYPIALEGALKLKEIAYIHAEGYPAAEMKHGPIALVDENMPCVFISCTKRLMDKVKANMQEIKARKGKIIVIANEKIKEADDIIIIPKTIEELSPILSVIPLQLFAYHIAVLLGRDVDKPRNLAKSVTVE